MGHRIWWLTAIAGAALLPLIMLLPDGPALELAWVALATGTLLATRVGRRLHPPADGGAHDLLTWAVGALVVATTLEVSWWASSPDSTAATLASVTYAVSFLLLAAAMFRFVAMRMPTGDAEGLIDGGLVAVATATVLFDVVAAPAVAGVYSETGAAALVLLPLLMASVLASIVRVLLTGAHRQPSAWLFLTAAAASMTGNVLYIATSASPHDHRLRLLWLAGYVLLSCAMLHPSLVRLCEPAPLTGGSLAFGRLAVIGAALSSLPATMLRHQEADASKVPAFAAIVCVGLVLWRIARLLRDRERAAEALHRRAEREAALSELGRAAVRATDRTAFTPELTAAIHRALGVSSSLTRADVDRRVEPTTIVVPLGSSCLGALEVRFPPDRPADEEDLQFVRTTADLAAAALRRWDAEDQLRHRSLHDHLTGLPNRALVCDRLERAIVRAGTTGGDLVVLFIDLDGFKTINDTLGHGAGDELLGEVAQRLLAQVRPGDVVGRLAGDEFVVVCEDAPTRAATALAHRLLSTISVPFELDLGDAVIGASIGLACAEPGDNPEMLLHRADEAMYRAKHAGKGQVTVWSAATAAT